ncbi:MAG: hypothetical protein COS08_07785 [Euryarchaeota archaeon CG01_land_8_20_14_3_00_38_12]|nr:MAG: hypothetical protein COS08_07785 [Euryarchaeota archaeon CG01_land_8_20_14_3_00_38_12]
MAGKTIVTFSLLSMKIENILCSVPNFFHCSEIKNCFCANCSPLARKLVFLFEGAEQGDVVSKNIKRLFKL